MARLVIIGLAIGAIALPATLAPTDADAASCRSRKATGTVIGGLGGALVGNAISKGGGAGLLDRRRRRRAGRPRGRQERLPSQPHGLLRSSGSRGASYAAPSRAQPDPAGLLRPHGQSGRQRARSSNGTFQQVSASTSPSAAPAATRRSPITTSAAAWRSATSRSAPADPRSQRKSTTMIRKPVMAALALATLGLTACEKPGMTAISNPKICADFSNNAGPGATRRGLGSVDAGRRMRSPLGLQPGRLQATGAEVVAEAVGRRLARPRSLSRWNQASLGQAAGCGNSSEQALSLTTGQPTNPLAEHSSFAQGRALFYVVQARAGRCKAPPVDQRRARRTSRTRPVSLWQGWSRTPLRPGHAHRRPCPLALPRGDRER
jgi:hypothetical protein